jgi:prolipoprotein diacylglyceryltransferase
MAYLLHQGIKVLLFMRYRDSKPGVYISVFLIVVFSVRFLLEFLKMPDGDMVLGVISKTQALNLPFIATGIIMGVLTLQGKLKYNTPAHV